MIYSSRYGQVDVPDSTITQYILEHAGRWPDRVALRDGATRYDVSYGGLVEAVARTGSALANVGVAPGDVVAVVAPNQPWWVIALHGALWAGAVVTPVNPLFTEDELGRILELSRAKVVVADASIEDKARRAAGGVGARVVLIGGDGGEDDLVGMSEAGDLMPPVRRSADDVAILPFSSGTTGFPKGVELTHRNLVAVIAQHLPVYGVGAGDVVLVALPMFHIYGLSIITNYSLRQGATLVTMARFDAGRYLELVVREQATWLHLAPPMVLTIAGLEDRTEHFRSVRRVLSGGAPLDVGVQKRAEAVMGCDIYQGYGMTETGPGITMVPDGLPSAGALGSLGLLLPGTEARLVDPDSGRDAPRGGPGELWVRGQQVMRGYLNDPVATAATIVEDGWLRTGDIARIDDDGCLRVVDRLKELIKYKGYQVAPAELESILLSHPQVADAAVVGVPDLAAGEIPFGFVVTADRGFDPQEAMEWVAQRVAPYKKIRGLSVIDSIPKSASGKILRKDLRARIKAGSAANGTAGQPDAR